MNAAKNGSGQNPEGRNHYQVICLRSDLQSGRLITQVTTQLWQSVMLCTLHRNPVWV
jgi:hypothetical protein